MIELPTEYTTALEEVLGQSLTRQALEDRRGKEFVRTITSSISQISQGLTKDRSTFLRSKYLSNPALQRAYLLYYTTTNLLKLWPPLRELAASGFFGRSSSVKHLDLGAGTGAAVWGLATYLKHEQRGIQTLSNFSTDVLPQNLRTIGAFNAHFTRHISPLKIDLRTAQMDLAGQKPMEGETYDLITLMNVVNEIDEERDAQLISRLTSLIAERGAVIMIEPSTREQSRRALRFRDQMVEAGFHVYAPCCRTNECPALQNEGDWCHTEVRWKRPEFIKAIDDLAGTLRLSLKSTYAIFLKEDLNLSDFLLSKSHQAIPHRDFHTAGRIVSERFDEKGRVRMFVCNERGRKEYILNKRDRTPRNKAAMDARRYDLVQIEGIELREHDTKIARESVINILNNAEGLENVDNLG